MKTTAQRPDSSSIRSKLKLKNLEASSNARGKHTHVEPGLLSKAFDIKSLRSQSAKLLGAGALASTMAIAAPAQAHFLPPPEDIMHNLKLEHAVMPIISPQKVLIESMKKVLPNTRRPLTRAEEKTLERVFEDTLGIKARATLEGEHLNTTYGLIGLEQHLQRYPGDTLRAQAEHTEDEMLEEGMAPGRGAWGYFANSKAELTPDLIEKEKWYAVVQTLYLPDWNTRTRYLKEWYKHRKVVIINTQNGKAVVAAIADSGPAAWTGKVFGGSPEVMHSLGGPRYTKGPVVLFFVDDPENKVPLGPVEYNKIQVPEWAFREL